MHNSTNILVTHHLLIEILTAGILLDLRIIPSLLLLLNTNYLKVTRERQLNPS
jgi:hypothetical protein